ncbi:hypothetical protein RBE51_21140 [Pseudomonas taiwanensis]|uniref:hypothetical protein n=1 Tax=Pseudomonas taiwanensis TaxID=470150 RepID=UPI0028DDB1BD|nr:hypothetical protein [Pseudomonas taiwanensis]MDT8925303.1 hypothetical protein [Pseudomonas taiwanensis]
MKITKSPFLNALAQNIRAEYDHVDHQRKTLPPLSDAPIKALWQPFMRGATEAPRLFFAPLTGLVKTLSKA